MQTDLCAMRRFQPGFDTCDFHKPYVASDLYENDVFALDFLRDLHAGVLQPLQPLHYNLCY